MRRGLPIVAVALLVLAACTATTPQPTPAPAPPGAALGLATANVKLTHVVDLANAITMATRVGDDSLYFGTQDGVVRRFRKGRFYPVLDIRSSVLFTNEQGLLGMTFNPAGDKLYVHYSRKPDGFTEVDEFPFANGGATSPGRVVLIQSQPQANHNGGSLLFGPADHLLYLALGDGGGANDTATGHIPVFGNGQTLTTDLGKLLRIDPTDPTPGNPIDVGAGASYTVPPTNPFAGGGGNPEIWSYGLRNPYRISFDRGDGVGTHKGDLWIGDVGQDQREEIDFLTVGDPTHPSGKGANFGWNRREGDIDGPNTNDVIDPSFIAPVLATTHDDVFLPTTDPGDCAIIGGYVYRGARIPDLVGAYVFTDLCDSRIQAFTPNGAAQPTDRRTLMNGVGNGVSFGEDNNGELYLLSLSTGVYRIDPVVPPIRRT